MYNNTGVKIKNLASLFMVLNGLLSLTIAIVLYALFENFLIAVIVFGVGILIAWLSYLLLAGFGELIAETCYTREAVELLTEELEAANSAKKLKEKEKKKETETASDNDLKGTFWEKATQASGVGAFAKGPMANEITHNNAVMRCPYCGKELTDNYCADCCAYFGE